jgi:hypothetical protein
MAEGAEELFGARHQAVRLVREPGGAHRWTPLPRGYGEMAPATVLEGAEILAGQRLQAGFYLQTLTPTTGTPILHDGQTVAGVRHRVGAGTAILIGTFAGLSATAHRHPESDACIERLLADAGVTPDRCGRLLRRRRVLGEKQAWFLINPHEEPVQEVVDLGDLALVGDLLDEPLERALFGAVRLTVPAAGLRCLVLAERGSHPADHAVP